MVDITSDSGESQARVASHVAGSTDTDRFTRNNVSSRSGSGISHDRSNVRSGARGRGRARLQCQLCGKNGHSVDRCWHRFDQSFAGVLAQPNHGKDEAGVAHVAQAEGQCYACCGSSNGQSSAGGNGWVVDSGATHHVTPDAAKMQQSSDYLGPALPVVSTAGSCTTHTPPAVVVSPTSCGPLVSSGTINERFSNNESPSGCGEEHVPAESEQVSNANEGSADDAADIANVRANVSPHHEGVDNAPGSTDAISQTVASSQQRGVEPAPGHVFTDPDHGDQDSHNCHPNALRFPTHLVVLFAILEFSSLLERTSSSLDNYLEVEFLRMGIQRSDKDNNLNKYDGNTVLNFSLEDQKLALMLENVTQLLCGGIGMYSAALAARDQTIARRASIFFLEKLIWSRTN
ncbi:hypothetical protein GQ457_06G025160 [Hibiscus cannabinus]